MRSAAIGRRIVTLSLEQLKRLEQRGTHRVEGDAERGLLRLVRVGRHLERQGKRY